LLSFPGPWGRRSNNDNAYQEANIDLDQKNNFAMHNRRFPPPWSVDELEACFVVRDHSGQALAYVYFEDEPGRRSAAKLLTKDEARRIATNIAKLPQLTRGESPRPPTPEPRAEFVRATRESRR
jgi:hypothetical protein